MVTKVQLNTLKQKSSHQALLSLYLDIHPGKSDTQEGAPLIRAKEALKELALPKPFIQEILSLLSTELVRRQARTLVLFTNEDLGFYKRFALQLELPELNEKGVLAAWGKALTAPLRRLTDTSSRYAVVYIDKARWRYFEAFLMTSLSFKMPLDP